ncbi:hypothetical protein IID62_10835 [candidate division KSB1 bacterium]|nr:hypothetical protein [candidate division KSB1 bacterium]
MGWNARLSSGLVLRQRDGVNFSDVDLHNIRELWLDGLEKTSLHKGFCPGFVEFIQFETALIKGNSTQKTGEFIGWTNGTKEFVMGITTEKHNFHPESRLK